MKTPLERERELSYKVLANARAKKAGYDSEDTRSTFSDAVAAVCPVIKPYDWQLDVAEALALGLDATVIAGTGSGKTLPWALPLLLEENCNKICLVISPLNELEADHVCRRRTGTLKSTFSLLCFCLQARFFTEKLKIPTAAVNHETWNARDGALRMVCSKCSLYAPKTHLCCL